MEDERQIEVLPWTITLETIPAIFLIPTCPTPCRMDLPVLRWRLVQWFEGGGGIVAIGGVQGIIRIVLVGRIKRIIGRIAISRVDGIPGIELVCRIKRIVGSICLCRIQRVIRRIATGRIEDVVVALVLLIEAHPGPSETEPEEHRRQDEERTHHLSPERRYEKTKGILLRSSPPVMPAVVGRNLLFSLRDGNTVASRINEAVPPPATAGRPTGLTLTSTGGLCLSLAE